jgi:hypothetical protein
MPSAKCPMCGREMSEDTEQDLVKSIQQHAKEHHDREVCNWIRAHNRQVKREGRGVRILVCRLPTKSPWLNPIEPKGAHGKGCIAEPEAALSAEELVDRVCAVFDCEHEPYLSIPKEVA